MAGQPVHQAKKKAHRLEGERVSVPLVKIAMADGTTQRVLAEAIIRAVASRCFTTGCTGPDFLIMLSNWTSALTEGSDEIAGALAEAGYEAEMLVVDFDRSLAERIAEMVAVYGRFSAPKTEEVEEFAAREGSGRSEEETGLAEFKEWIKMNIPDPQTFRSLNLSKGHLTVPKRHKDLLGSFI